MFLRGAPRGIAASPTNRGKKIVGNSHGPTVNISPIGIPSATSPPTTIRPQQSLSASGAVTNKDHGVLFANAWRLRFRTIPQTAAQVANAITNELSGTAFFVIGIA